jgi:hypothetical protein
MPVYNTAKYPPAAYPGDVVTVANAESVTTGTFSQQVALQSGPLQNPAEAIALEISFSGAPGAFSFQLQEATTDIAAAYQNIGTAITAVGGSGQYARQVYTSVKGPFVRLSYATQPANSVTVTAKIVR